MGRQLTVFAAIILVIGGLGEASDPTIGPLPGEPFVYTRWQTFEARDGLPNDHIFALTADGDRLWVGTEGGLARFEDDRWTTWTTEDGLPFDVISAIAVSPVTGDVWIGLLGGGLARFSGGRFDHFNQFNSGLVNDVVYGVAVLGDTVWIATTAGMSAFDTRSQQWQIFTERNAPMDEIWCYNVDARDGKVYAAVWGGGILEYEIATQRWNAHRDPDREMEIDLYRDDGLIHNITTSASYLDDVLWASTYFGLSRYDGRAWRGYLDKDSGLASNFINLAKARSATSCYNATDMGLAVLVDSPTDTWVTYRRETEDVETWSAIVGIGNEVVRTVSTDLDLPNDFVIAVEFQGDDIWVGTGHGLARGIGGGYYEGLSGQQAGEEE
ncbi:MAG: regulator [bacterium]|nr:regulator [bacterium]